MNQPGTDEPGPATLVEALGRAAGGSTSSRGFSFLSDGDEVTAGLPFDQLDRRARAIGAGLARSLKPGDRVILHFPPGLDFIEGLFGCFHAGAVAVPVPWQRPGRANPQLGAIIEDSGATVALTTRAVWNHRDRFVQGEPRLGPLRWLPIENCLEGRDDPSGTPSPDDLAFLQYTSGSTGTPKGVMLPHRALMANIEGMRRLLGLGPNKVGVCWLPPFHDMGLIGNILQVVHSGMDLVMMPPAAFVQSPVRWLRAISRFRAHVSGGPNFAFDLCARSILEADREGLDLSSWEVAYVGAEPVSPRTLDRFARAFAPQGFRPETFYPCFGLAEATLMVSGGDRSARPVVRSVPRDDSTPAEVVGCGRAVPGLDVRVVDPASGEPLEAGQVGEIWVHGPSVGQGYWGRPAETEETFHASLPGLEGRAFLRTGDLGFLDGGELFVSGRIKDMIIVRGKNHFPRDIEEVAAASDPDLKPDGLVAFGVESEGETRLELLAEVSRHLPAARWVPLVDAIRRAIAEKLGLEAHSVSLVRAPGLPKTSSGKARRLESRKLALAGELDVVHCWAAPSLLEPGQAKAPKTRREVRDWLVSRITRHRGTSEDRISTSEPFATFGLDSVSMVTISSELADLLESPLSPTLLYDAPTIDALAEALTVDPSRVKELESDQSPGEPIAIIGGGCRFPGADSLEGFWTLLLEGRDAVGPIPPGRRWSKAPGAIASDQGGFLPEVDRFDAPFFGISPREAAYIDPQHRLLLEVAWEALEDAGLAADELAGRAVGVFAGITGSDYGRMLATGPGLDDAYWGTGNAASLAANRISYHLDLTGPSLTVDTACSSSLVAVHLAVQSLRSGESELALAAGVNLMLAPEVSVALTRARMLSESGRCRAFDARADGYVRGEGCGVVVLKPLAAALRDGDRVLAVIRGTAINQDGKSNGITAPNGTSQAALIRSSLRDAGVEAGRIGYVEAHGSGTILGDPIEVDALKVALSEGPLPCAIGTVKTNLGHLEAAAGVAGLLKAALQLDRGVIARHLHFERSNPHIDLEGTRFFVPDKPRRWPSPEGSTRMAGVSSFGFGGTNAHVVLESPPASVASASTSRPAHLLAISSRSPAALKALAGRYVARLSEALTPAETADLCFTANTGRVHFPHRLAIRGDSAEGLRLALMAYEQGTPADGLHEGEAGRDLGSRVAFLFGGQGSQHPGMARGLHASCPPFRAAIKACDAILRGLGERPIGPSFDGGEPGCPQVALFALEHALAETWRSWGVVPAAVMGHSLGEYAAACVAGVFSLEDGLRLVAGRGRLMAELCGEGAMASVFAPLEIVAEWVASRGDSLAVAAINGPTHVVISGSKESVRSACDHFQRRGITSQGLDVTRAFHSPWIEPALGPFAELASSIRFDAPSIPLISNLTGQPIGDEVRDPGYWCRHARRPVRFLEGARRLLSDGFDTFVEVGPTSTLSSLAQVGLAAGSAAFVPSLRKGRDDWRTLLDALGTLYARGLPIDWRGFDAPKPRRKVALPTYPFERQRHWVAPSATAPAPSRPTISATTWRSRTRWDHSVEPASKSEFAPLADLSGRLEALADGLFNDRNPARRPGQKADFDRLAAGYAVSAVRELGWEPGLAERVTVASLAERLGVPGRLHRFFGRMVQVLAEEGSLEPWMGGWEVVRPLEPVDMPALQAEVERRHPEWLGELTLAGRCGEALGRVLRGVVDPLEVLFPGGSAALLEGLYETSPVAQLSNDVVARAIEEAVGLVPSDRVVRILELGAGTGGTTSHVLPRLPEGRCEYVFSDISGLFTARARDKFAAYDFLEYRVLDLEGDPAASGLAAHQFDVILAANVLHATADLRRTLAGVRRLLAPSGLLVLLEGTGPQRLPDLVFGMAEGWWKFTDVDLRGAHPLLPRRAWVELLRGEGFAEAAALPKLEGEGVGEGEPDQAVILARGPASVASTRPTREVPVGLGWLVFSDGPIGLALADDLRAAGEPCSIVEAGEADAKLEAGRYAIDPRDDGDLGRRLGPAIDELGCSRMGVVHLWGLAPSKSLNEALGLGLGLAIRLDQSALSPDPLWVVTRGAIPAADVDGASPPDQATLWAFAGSAHGGRTTKRADLDPGVTPESAARLLAWEILRPDEDDTLAFRGSRRLASRVSTEALATPTGEVASSTTSKPAEGPTLAEVRAAEGGDRLDLIERVLLQELGRVLSIEPGRIGRDLPVNTLGLDSLMAIQLKNRIELRLGVSLSIITLLEGLSVSQISRKMDEDIGVEDDKIVGSFKSVNGTGHGPRCDPAANRPAAAPERSTLDQMVADLESLPESELDSLLDDLLGPDGFGDEGDGARPF